MPYLDDAINIIDNTRYASERNNKSGTYSKSLLDYIAKEARSRGINPAIPKAMALIETNVGNTKNTRLSSGNFTSNPMRYNYRKEGYVPDFDEMAAQTYSQHVPYNIVANAMTDKGQAVRRDDSIINQITNSLSQKDSINRALDYLKDGMNKHPNNLAKAIQFYNGEGKIPAHVAPAYGMSGTIDASKNPVYGKKVLEYTKLFK